MPCTVLCDGNNSDSTQVGGQGGYRTVTSTRTVASCSRSVYLSSTTTGFRILTKPLFSGLYRDSRPGEPEPGGGGWGSSGDLSRTLPRTRWKLAVN